MLLWMKHASERAKFGFRRKNGESPGSGVGCFIASRTSSASPLAILTIESTWAEYAREEARILASQEAAGCAHLYRQADEAKIRGDLLWERFIKTKPTSIEGALAKLEFLIGSDAGEATLTLIADLRSLCGVSAAEPDRAEEPSEIGFGEYEPRI
jgi:hypothetical protein